MLDKLCKAHSIGVSYKICEKAWIYNFEFAECSQIGRQRQAYILHIAPLSNILTVFVSIFLHREPT